MAAHNSGNVKEGLRLRGADPSDLEGMGATREAGKFDLQAGIAADLEPKSGPPEIGAFVRSLRRIWGAT